MKLLVNYIPGRKPNICWAFLNLSKANSYLFSLYKIQALFISMPASSDGDLSTYSFSFLECLKIV